MNNLSKQKISLIFGGVSAEHDLSLRAFHNIYTELQQQRNPDTIYQNVYYIKEDGLVIKKPFNFAKEADYYISRHDNTMTVLETLQQIKVNNEYVFSLLYGGEVQQFK